MRPVGWPISEVLGFSTALSRRSVISDELWLKCGVHAGDDDVHLLEHRVGEIEGAVGQDVHFDAGKNS